MRFHRHVDPEVLQSVGLDPNEDVIVTSLHEFKALCTVCQNHVSAIIPQAAILQDPPDEQQKGAGDAALPNEDPYRVPALPSEVPSV
jgi:hypothetical protein